MPAGRVEQLHATVVTTAAAARQLYRHLGFQTYGLEPRGLKVGDQLLRPGADGAAAALSRKRPLGPAAEPSARPAVSRAHAPAECGAPDGVLQRREAPWQGDARPRGRAARRAEADPRRGRRDPSDRGRRASPVLTTKQGIPVADDQNSLKAGRARPDAARGLPLPREDLPLRPRAHPRARRPCPRLSARTAFSRPTSRSPTSPAPTCSSAPARRPRCSCASRPSPAARARPTSPATCAASRSSSTPRKATGTSSATTSRCSSSRTRSSSPTSSTPPSRSPTAAFRRRRPRTTTSGTSSR